jgi:glycosyltransferase involved in cell wall biosynthesis
MKIGVEASVLIRKQRTGVDNYTYRLLAEAVRQMPNDLFYLTYISFFTKKPADMGIYGANVAPRKLNILPGRIYHLFIRKLIGIPYDLVAMIRPDIFFFPNFVRWPLLWTKKSVIVVYDLSFLHASEHAVRRHSQYLAKFVPISIRKASHVVAISENTQREIIEQYGTDPGKISVIYPAVDHEFFKPAEMVAVEEMKQKLGIEQPYILSVGTIEPRKNLVGLLRAYEQLDEKLKQQYGLVLTGGKGWLDGEINDLYERLSKKYSVIRTGYVDDADLPALYTGASVFAFPAFYEGFGMPPLEAMACGTPVVVGDNSSLPEVVGDAGLKVDAHDTVAIAGALTQLLTDENLAAGMRAKGLIQAKKFIWSTEAAKLVEVFKRVGSVK